MQIVLIAVLTAVGLGAHAQTVHRCVQKGRPTVFQNQPCPSGATTAPTLAYVPDPDAPPYRPSTTRAPQSEPRRRARAHSLRITAPASPSACESARRHRDSVLGSKNQGGNVDVRRVLNHAVAKACY